MKVKAVKLVSVAVTFVLFAELGVRLAGMVDFPLYDANAQIGYIPAANQSGAFLNKNTWRFNELHMGADPFKPGPAGNVLLVGDSLVLGGNSYDDENRLGPRLRAALPPMTRVWPISAGSWALRNELAYLRANPLVLDEVSALVWVVNAGDFTEASSWSCELTHPTHTPPIALLYLFEKYVHAFTPCDGTVPADLQVPPGDLQQELKDFLARHAHKVLFVWYADKLQQANGALRHASEGPQLAALKAAGARYVLTVTEDSRWSAAYYKDSIHPTPEGNQVLASIIRDGLEKAGFASLSPSAEVASK